MTKFYGKAGFVYTEETSPGVWTPETTERPYYFETTRNGRRYETGSSTNDNLLVTSNITMIADPFALEHVSMLRWIEMYGVKWRVSTVDILYPRLTLTLGGVYNGVD